MKNIYCIGDTHSIRVACNYIEDFINKYNITDSLLIQVGDFGLGFNKVSELEQLTNINDILKRTNNELYVIRGNHDNPSYFNGEYIRDNIKLLKDYTVIDNILFIGGAISVDRLMRIKNVSYWEDEKLVYNDIVKTLTNIEYVITHSCPSFVNKLSDKEFFRLFCNNEAETNKLMNDCLEERNTLTQIYNELKSKNNNIRKWYYGHFHNDTCEFIDNTEFQCLDECDYLSQLTIKQLK